MPEPETKKSPADVGRELFEKEEAADREIAKKYDPVAIIKKGTELHRIVDKQEGEILYYPIQLEDLDDIGRAKTEHERTQILLFKLLGRAYPELTLEAVKKMPLMKAAYILEVIGKVEGFYGDAASVFLRPSTK
jgi:hypothetical protein